MLSVVIKDPLHIAEGILYGDVLELRLDLFPTFCLENIRALRQKYKVPMIFTLKKHKSFTEEMRRKLIFKLLEIHPEYLDIESDMPETFIKEVFLRRDKTKIILSYHDFQKTPKNLDALYSCMQKLPADLYKIAVTANTPIDALYVASFVKKSKGNLIAVSMGPLGQITRILAPVIGSYLTYASLEVGEHGQLSARELQSKYRFSLLSKKSKVYALIGDPVDLSISDVTHNQFFAEEQIDAVYVKIPVKKKELASFLQEAKNHFLGLSVTMPLKEDIMEHLSDIDHEAHLIGAVNTLVLQDGSWKGYNTDGIGALTALEEKGLVAGKAIAIIGTGGAAKAIAYEANKRGAILSVISRSPQKARALENQLKIRRQESAAYDVIINCTPADHPGIAITPGAVVMDIKTVPHKTEFLLEAEYLGCSLVYGHSMFIEQAMGQFALWFRPQAPQPFPKSELAGLR
jgi:3-dehydroquinate dehydratase / shikimate dehydrogenase